MVPPCGQADTARMETSIHDPRQTTVYIVEDSAPVRARLSESLDALDGVRVVGEAETPFEAVQGILAAQPNCVVLDFQLLGGTGVEVLKQVCPLAPDIAFIVLTNHPNPQYRRICMDAGARHFFDKSTEFHRVKDVIAAHSAPNF